MQAIDVMDKLDNITVDEACKIAKISPATFYNFLGENNIKKTFGVTSAKRIVSDLKEKGLFA